VELTAHGAGFFPGLPLAQTRQPVREQVDFLGFKDWPELPACYAAADILCVPPATQRFALASDSIDP
jgi:hypothetical protein